MRALLASSPGSGYTLNLTLESTTIGVDMYLLLLKLRSGEAAVYDLSSHFLAVCNV